MHMVSDVSEFLVTIYILAGLQPGPGICIWCPCTLAMNWYQELDKNEVLVCGWVRVKVVDLVFEVIETITNIQLFMATV